MGCLCVSIFAIATTIFIDMQNHIISVKFLSILIPRHRGRFNKKSQTKNLLILYMQSCKHSSKYLQSCYGNMVSLI